eukprot:5938929-Lingulodinium_polyedra.AAC.1
MRKPKDKNARAPEHDAGSAYARNHERAPKHELCLQGMPVLPWRCSCQGARAHACLQTMHRRAPPECTSA